MSSTDTTPQKSYDSQKIKGISSSALIIFILYILVSSDVFVDNFLVYVNGTTNGRDITMLGTLIQALSLVVLWVVFENTINK